MELHSRLTESEKAASWAAKKEKIAYLVSHGLDLKQIEEELELDGSRITSQVRDHIIWTINWPDVKVLLNQRLDVETIENKMHLKDGIWTDALRNKAWWEFHREEIISLYKHFRSVEAVRERMVKKGFTPQYVIEVLH
jgi:SOS response regulatory protein OraA/RecX